MMTPRKLSSITTSTYSPVFNLYLLISIYIGLICAQSAAEGTVAFLTHRPHNNNHRHCHHHHRHQLQVLQRRPTTSLQEQKGADRPKKQGYQFGDISKSLINRVTKKDKYEFGDLSKHLDAKVKGRIAELNNKNEYEFGDLTKYLVWDFTNNNNSTSTNNSTSSSSSEYKYRFGDITKEITRRVRSRDYTLDDMALLIKGLVSFGVGLSPVASFLPVKLLIDLLNYSIAGDLGTRVTSSISLELDRRMKKALTGNEDYKLGDATKEGILKYTGRDEYTFGDITKKVVNSMDEYDRQQKKIAELNEELKRERKRKGSNDADGTVTKEEGDESVNKSVLLTDEENFDKIAKELKEWDEKFLKNPNNEKHD